MKRIIATALMLLMTVGAFAQEGKRLYNKYSDQDGVSAVYISPAMFKLIGQLPDINIESADGRKMDMDSASVKNVNRGEWSLKPSIRSPKPFMR